MSLRYKLNARVFKALSDPVRLQVLEILRTGERCAYMLLEELDVTQSGLSYHMKILVSSGLVDSRSEGKWVYYRLSKSGMRQALSLLEALCEPA